MAAVAVVGGGDKTERPWRKKNYLDVNQDEKKDASKAVFLSR